MSRARLLFLGFLVVIAACSTTSEHEHQNGAEPVKVALPAGSELTYTTKPSQPNYFYFDGEVSLTGIVLAYWHAHYLEAEPTTLDKAKPVREMHLRFYPDTRSQNRLPTFHSNSDPIIRHQRIFLYRYSKPDEPLDILHSAYTVGDMSEIEEIVQDFSELPSNFLTHQEGFTLQPARLLLKDLVSFTEGDHRFLYGIARSLEPLSLTEYGLKQIPDSEPDTFLGKPWLEIFYAPNPLKVHDRPEQNGRVIAELPAGNPAIEKLRTVNQNWVLVRVQLNEKEVVTGYVQKSELMVIN